ncbi:MAG: vitamin K epoxide reductase family protein, partial [Desulfobacteraceae bacterium]|nr:vitamin K epoxide reductase family protein [Desulfobacteraceae bacterium]
MKSKKNISPLPFKYYFFPCGLLVIVGLFSSIYLSVSHYRVYTDIGYSSFCALSKAINCDTVSQSPYSIFLGIPVPIWGVLGYAIFLAGITLAGLPPFRPTRLWRLLFMVAALYSATSFLLAAISSFLIHSYCIMCIVTYGVNFGLLFYTWLIPRRFDAHSFISGFKKDLRALKGRKRLLWGWAGIFALAMALSWGLIP